MCLQPLIAGLEPYVDEDGVVKNRVHLSISESLLHPEWKQIQIPCGRCVECLNTYSTQWAYRVMEEAKLYKRNCFITLTYAPGFEPRGGVQKRDLQLFFKRLRGVVGKVRYFATGEYGERTGRPHYHACLFGYDFPDKYFFRQDKRGNLLYRSPLLERLWPFGFSSVGALDFESAKYCAKYMQKLLDISKELNQPFLLMSRRPGLAALSVSAVQLETDKVYSKSGYISLPRYYLRLLEKQGISVSDVREQREIRGQLLKSSPERIEERKQMFIDKFGKWR